MLKRLLALAALACAITFAPPADAQQRGDWQVTARHGVVRLRSGAESRDARLHEVLPPGTVVTTGADSSTTIENGLQRITMSSNSRMTVVRTDGAGVTRIIQSLGSILFQVDHQEAPHFFVDTPRLAAIVKGTTFTVIVRERWDVVAVANGLVEVRSNSSHSAVNVPTGHAARVTAEDPDQVTLYTDASQALSGSAAAPGDSLQLRGDPTGAQTRQDGEASAVANAANPAPPTPQNGSVWHRLRERSRDQDWLVRMIFLYFGASFTLGFGAHLGFRWFDRRGRIGANQRGGS